MSFSLFHVREIPQYKFEGMNPFEVFEMHCREKHFLHGSPSSQYPSVFNVFPCWFRTTAVAAASPRSVAILRTVWQPFLYTHFDVCPSSFHGHGTLPYEQTWAVLPINSSQWLSSAHPAVWVVTDPPWAWPIAPPPSMQGPLVWVPTPAGPSGRVSLPEHLFLTAINVSRIVKLFPKLK